MGVITLTIDDDLESRFRRKVSRMFGAGRGTLGKAVEESIRLWLEAPPEKRGEKIVYWAELDGKKVAEDTSLVGLADGLHKIGLDPRDVILRSSEPQPKERHLGFPTARTPK